MLIIMRYLFPGEQISQKYGYMKVMYIRDDCSVTISSHIPDFHYSFNANFTNNWKGRMFEFTVAEVLTRYGLAVTAFVFKVFILHRSSLTHKSKETYLPETEIMKSSFTNPVLVCAKTCLLFYSRQS